MYNLIRAVLLLCWCCYTIGNDYDCHFQGHMSNYATVISALSPLVHGTEISSSNKPTQMSPTSSRPLPRSPPPLWQHYFVYLNKNTKTFSNMTSTSQPTRLPPNCTHKNGQWRRSVLLLFAGRCVGAWNPWKFSLSFWSQVSVVWQLLK